MAFASKKEATSMTVEKVDLKRSLDCYRARYGQFRVLTVPPMLYLALDGHVDAAVNAAAASPKAPRLDDVRVLSLDERRAVQTLHVGPYDDEGPVLDNLIASTCPNMTSCRTACTTRSTWAILVAPTPNGCARSCVNRCKRVALHDEMTKGRSVCSGPSSRGVRGGT